MAQHEGTDHCEYFLPYGKIVAAAENSTVHVDSCSPVFAIFIIFATADKPFIRHFAALSLSCTSVRFHRRPGIPCLAYHQQRRVVVLTQGAVITHNPLSDINRQCC